MTGRTGQESGRAAVDAVVVGGGPAGGAAAITLARAGRHVVLLEKEPQPQHKVCGEFLSQEALSYLRMLGVDAAALGAVPVHSVRLAAGAGAPSATRFSAPLPFAAMSLTRRSLDAALLRSAEAAGVTVLRGHQVHRLERSGEGWMVSASSAQADTHTLAANAAFLATGKHDMHARPRPPGRQNDLVAFKMYWRLAPEQAAALAGHVELVLYRGGYAGLQTVEDDAANLCCLVERRELQRLSLRGAQQIQTRGASHWQNLLAAMQRACPHLRARLQGATPLLNRPLAASAIPYGYVRASTDGVWVLGDQAAVIPSFTGDGMSIALHSGCLAAAMYLAGATAESFQQRLHVELRSQVALATTLSRAIVRSPLQGLLAASVAIWPGVLGSVAERTRIAASAMLCGAAL